MIYEARPNVTVDAAGLALKSGNAVILRGGSRRGRQQRGDRRVLSRALVAVGLPGALVQSIDAWGREGAVALMHARGLVDVLVPRGGADLIRTVVRESTVPVVETGVGNVHVYVDETADLASRDRRSCSTPRRSGSASATRPRRCWCTRRSPTSSCRWPSRCWPTRASRCTATRRRSRSPRRRPTCVPATDVDWATEYLSLDIAVRVVDSLDEALDHIRALELRAHRGDHHAGPGDPRERFVAEVDSAAVMVERLDAVHRRRPARPRRRDRHLHPEAARPGADGPRPSSPRPSGSCTATGTSGPERTRATVRHCWLSTTPGGMTCTLP